MVILYILPHFGILYQEKSGKPAKKSGLTAEKRSSKKMTSNSAVQF
jgi:hypothetical protein